MTVTIRQAELLPASALEEHPDNSQKQSKHEFSELRRSIRENGFDESLIVVPKENGDGYWIVSGNHRYRAGVAEGMEQFPCVIREDWDDVKAQIELVRRNYVRGKIDRDAFTAQVDRLVNEQLLSIDEVMKQMGFASDSEFELLYKAHIESEEKAHRDIADGIATSNASTVKMIDDLGYIVSTLLDKYGDTVPYSFIMFPAGGKNHMYIAANPTLKKNLEAIAEACVGQHLDINVALAGLLSIGLAQTNFLAGQGKREVVDIVEEDEGGDADLEII